MRPSTSHANRDTLAEKHEPANKAKARPARIPMLIHQFWDRLTPPDDVAERMVSWQDKHPAWTYLKWNDESMVSFLLSQFGEEAARRYRACVVPAMRSDLVRISALLTFGGVYADADTKCLKAVDPLTDARCTMSYRDRDGMPWMLHNALIVCERDHPLMRAAWKAVMQNVKKAGRKDWRKLRKSRTNDIAAASGPKMFTDVYRALPEQHRNKVRLIEEVEYKSYISPSRNLSYVKAEGSWKERMKRERIVDFGKADNRD